LTGKTYRTLFAVVLALAFGRTDADADGPALADADGLVAGPGAAGTADSVGTGWTNRGSAVDGESPPGAPQPARHSASTVRDESVRTRTTAPSWQKAPAVAVSRGTGGARWIFWTETWMR
jgi:hypothetical protein